MPVLLPQKSSAETVRAQKREFFATLDCFGLWVLSVAATAAGLAGAVYLLDGDSVGASLVLVCAAAIIATMSHVCAEPKS
ncbi:MAG TPA: hypothetical protein VJR71_13805 [Pseudolabrys sp.]|nr:hypothetical protein [Pseudolabrys sp.]